MEWSRLDKRARVVRSFVEGAARTLISSNARRSLGGVSMNEIEIEIGEELLESIVSDLKRPHRFAYERVGFVYCDFRVEDKTLVARTYEQIRDEDYLREKYVGACIGRRPIRNAINAAFVEAAAVFHIHTHEHRGVPFFSGVDEGFYEELIPALRAVNSSAPHGAFLLSEDSLRARIWGLDGLVRDYEFENYLFHRRENEFDK